MLSFKHILMSGTVIMVSIALPSISFAEDCTAVLPSADCTLDENTTAPLTIDSGVTLTIGGSVSIDHEVNGNVIAGDGDVQTNSGGIVVDQRSAIGINNAIDSLTIGDGDRWISSADIITNNNGFDIDLGAGDGGEVLDLNTGLTFVGQLDGHANDILNIGADGNGGTFTGNGSINSVTLNIISGTFIAKSTLGGTTSLNDVFVSDISTLNLEKSLTSSGVFDLDGSVSIQSGNSLTADTYLTDMNSGDINLGLKRTTGVTDSGSFRVSNGGPLDLSNDMLTFNFENGGEVISSETILNVIVGNGGATIAPTIQDNSFLYDFFLVPNANNLNLDITRMDLNVAATSKNNRISANSLLGTLGDLPSITLRTIQTNLANASTEVEFNNLLESTQPTVSGDISRMSRNVSRQTVSLVKTRVDALSRSKNTKRLVASVSNNVETSYFADASFSNEAKVVTNKTYDLAQRRLRYLKKREDKLNSYNNYADIREHIKLYDDDRGISVWGQTFGGIGSQERKDSIDGYDFNTVGFSFGADTGKMEENLLIGSVFTYALSDINSDNSNNTDIDMETFQVGLYTSYLMDNDYFINNTVAYGFNNISSIRHDVGGTGLNASASYDSSQLTFHSEVGKPVLLGNQVLLTPSFSTEYNYISFEDYIEDGALGANLNVKQGSIHSLIIGPEIKASINKKLDNGIYMTPEASLGYSYDTIQDKVSADSFFQDTTASESFVSEGFETQAQSINFGMSVELGKHDWQVKASYDYEWNEEFSAHNGLLHMNYNF